MYYQKNQISEKLDRWDAYLQAFHFPTWEELPDLELYMDQVVALISRYLDLLPHGEAVEPVITPSTVNNYVRMRIMPPPCKKRYTRLHLAYLIVICTLKQSLNIAYVSKILPMGIPEEEVRRIYGEFVRIHRATSLALVRQVRQAWAPDGPGDSAVQELVLSSAVYSNLYKLLTEKIVALQLEQAGALHGVPEPV